MVFQNLSSEGCGIHMGIDFRGGNMLMPQHGLDGTQVGSALKQCRCKRVAQSVGRDGLLNTRLHRQPLDHDENHRACQVGTPSVQEHIVFLSFLDVHVATHTEPQPHLFHCLR